MQTKNASRTMMPRGDKPIVLADHLVDRAMSAVVATHDFWESFFTQRRTPADPSELSEALEW